MGLFDGLPELFTETFGQAVVYTPLNGTAKTVQAIHFADAVDVELGNGGPPADGVRRRLELRIADVPLPAEGDTAVIDGVTYKVVPPIAPDGQGMVSVFLEATT